MQNRRGSADRNPRGREADERGTAKWPIGATRRHWEEEDPIPVATGSHPSLPPAQWDDDEAITARRSVPRLSRPSSWETVLPEDLIPSVLPPPPNLAPAPTAANAPSVGPVSLELEEAGEDDLEEVDFRRGLFPARSVFLAGAIAAAAALALLLHPAGLRRHATPAEAAPVLAAPPLPHDEESAIPPPPPPVVDEPASTEEVTAPPPAAKTTGIIVGTPDHRLYVDGRLVIGTHLEVSCGKHTARSGSRGTLRTIDVPCGGDVEVTP